MSREIPIVAAGVAEGWPQVQGWCPACDSRSLFLAAGGYVTCAIIRCPRPLAASEVFERRPNPQEAPSP